MFTFCILIVFAFWFGLWMWNIFKIVCRYIKILFIITYVCNIMNTINTTLHYTFKKRLKEYLFKLE